MIPYQINEAQLPIGDGWEDQSLQVFKLPNMSAGKPASFVVSRDLSRKNHEKFSAYVLQQKEQLSAKLPGLRLLKDENIHYQDHEGVWLGYSWSDGENELYIRQVFYDRFPLSLIFTLTCTAADSQRFAETWRRTMRETVLAPRVQLAESSPFPPPAAIVKKG